MADDEFIAKLMHLDAGDECPIHVAAAILKPDSRGKRRVVSGRGISAEEAERRCIAEAIERHAAVFDPGHGPVYASLDELGTTAADPRAILLISERQFESAAQWNIAVEADHRLPARFDPHAPIGWVAARHATTAESVYVPAAHVFLGYPEALSEGFPIPDSSGLAAGESASSALDRALFELIERDAVSIWWYGRVQCPELQIEARAVSWQDAFEDWMRRADRQFWLLDLSHDLGVPVVAAISCNAQGRDLSFGFAAGGSPPEAAASAMGELVQFDLSKQLQGGRDALHPSHFLTWCRTAAVGDHPFLRPGPSRGSSVIDPEPDPRAALTAAGLDPLFLALPVEGRAAHVVRAIVPELRPIWPRFAPGRLFDVTYGLGRHSRKLTESDLNPVPILY
ncbi:MAG: YcaO-like family protein [Rhizobiales bacterium]|nr:YcaO-like family protein [Hyphomicrobiales bacterium]